MRSGYVRIGRGGREYLEHRLVLADSTGVPYDNPLDACHKCDVRNCVNPEHLYWGTRSQNLVDKSLRAKRGRTLKLTVAHVVEIRASAESNRALADRYGVTLENIGMIRARKTWRHVE
ncbi:HNH endonuclease [Burkholderia cepacia]|uniref:HNH endonuclease n=1 Tax=Burkholderia cepacia TaxID=292 RepID=UPI0009BCFE18